MALLYRSVETAKVLLIMCVWGIFPLTTVQFPVREGFNLLLYPVSVMGPYGPQTVLIPMSTTEANLQHNQTPQTNHSKVSSQGLSKPLNANSAFIQPTADRVPAPDSAPSPSPDPLHQGQMSNFLPSNVPLQVYSLVQQAIISDSGSSEEGDAAQVIFMVPISVESPNMGVIESGVPNPDPGHLHIASSTSAPVTIVPLQVQGQLGKTEAQETVTRTDILGEKIL